MVYSFDLDLLKTDNLALSCIGNEMCSMMMTMMYFCVSPRSDKELAVSYPDLLLTDLKYKISNDNFSY